MTRIRRRAFHVSGISALEERLLLTGVTVDPIAAASVPVLKTLIVPLTGSVTNGDPLTYSVQSDNAAMTARVITNTVDVKMSVAGFGDMTWKLIPEFAPNTVSKISGLVQQGFYDNLIFHRVIKNFMDQGGDPNGNGSGGPGFQFDDEFNTSAIYSGDGQIAMANAGPDTNGSQFFLTNGPQRFLDFSYTIFGQVVRGLDVVKAINNVATGSNDRPLSPVTITSATLTPDTTSAVLLIQSTASGSANLTVTAQDQHGNSDSKSFLATSVTDTQNDPPILGAVPASVVTAKGQTVDITLSSVDLEHDTVIYTATPTNGTQNVTVSVSGNVVHVTPIAGFVGDIPIKVGVRQTINPTRTDTQSLIVTVKQQTVTVQASNPSIVEGTSNTTTVANFTTAVAYPASNYSATVTWADQTTSPAQVVAGAGGSFDVTITDGKPSAGSYAYTVKVTDIKTSVEGTANGTLTVTDASLSSQFVSISPTSGTRNVSGTVATVTDSNTNSVPSDLSALIEWGDSSSSAGTLVPKGNGLYDVTGTHTYAALGSYSVKVTISDVGGAGTNTSGTIVVPNLAPVLDAIQDQDVSVGTEIQVQAHATDPDSGQTLTYSLGQGAPSGATIDPNTGLFKWTPSSVTTAQVTIIVTDNGSPGLDASRTFSIHAPGVIPTVQLGQAASVNQNDTYTGTGSFITTSPGPFTATVDYGDGAGPQELTLNQDKTFSLSHEYASAGSFSITVVVTDSQLSDHPGSKSLAVSVASIVPVVTVGPAGNINRGDTYTGGGSFTDPSNGPWSATVDYGDGSLPQPLALNPDKTFSLSHVYATAGNFTITVVVTDAGLPGQPGSKTTTVAVGQVTPNVTAGPSKSINEGDTYTGSGSFTDPGKGPWTATVDYGDGSGSTNLPLNPDKTFSLSHLYASPGNYTVTVTVIDAVATDQPGVKTFGVSVANVAPSNLVAGPTGNINVFGTYTGSGSFVDPGKNNWAGSVDYGDGSGVRPLALNANKTFALSHQYDVPGTYTITVSIIDNALPNQPAVKTVTVNVADPAPTVQAGGPATILQYDNFTRVGTFTSLTPRVLTAKVNYGDATGDQPLTLKQDGTYQLSHVYTKAGTRQVVVTITDQFGVSGTSTFAVTVKTAMPRVALNKAWTTSVGNRPANTVTLLFSGMIDPQSVRVLSNYRLTLAGADGKFGVGVDPRILVRSVRVVGNTVALTLSRSLPLGTSFRLQVSGVKDESGRPLTNLVNGFVDGISTKSGVVTYAS